MFYGSAPVFMVTDVLQSVDYYCEVLGFERPALWGEPVVFAMPKRENIIIILQNRGKMEVSNNSGLWDAYFWVKDADQLFQDFKERGATVAYEPVLRDSYGCFEFAVKDPDGYTLAFGQEYENEPFFEQNPLAGKVGPVNAPSGQLLPKLQYLSPVLASADVPKDVAWYEDKLGFKNVYDSSHYREGPVDYAVVGRQNLYLHLQFQYPKDMTSTDIRFQVQHIETLAREFIAKGLMTADQIRRKTAWKTTEFGFFDPSGNRLTFFEDL